MDTSVGILPALVSHPFRKLKESLWILTRTPYLTKIVSSFSESSYKPSLAFPAFGQESCLASLSRIPLSILDIHSSSPSSLLIFNQILFSNFPPNDSLLCPFGYKSSAASLEFQIEFNLPYCNSLKVFLAHLPSFLNSIQCNFSLIVASKNLQTYPRKIAFSEKRFNSEFEDTINVENVSNVEDRMD